MACLDFYISPNGVVPIQRILCVALPSQPAQKFSGKQFFKYPGVIVLAQILPGHKEDQQHQHKMDAWSEARLGSKLPGVKQC